MIESGELISPGGWFTISISKGNTANSVTVEIVENLWKLLRLFSSQELDFLMRGKIQNESWQLSKKVIADLITQTSRTTSKQKKRKVNWYTLQLFFQKYIRVHSNHFETSSLKPVWTFGSFGGGRTTFSIPRRICSTLDNVGSLWYRHNFITTNLNNEDQSFS